MASKTSFYIIIALLLTLGFGLAIARYTYFGIPLTPDKFKKAWLLEARVDFEAESGPVLAALTLPENPPGYKILGENSASPGYGFAIIEHDGKRRGEWSRNNVNGPQTLYYKIQLVETGYDYNPQESDTVVADNVFWNETEDVAARYVVSTAGEKSSTPESFTRQLIEIINNPEPEENAALLLSSYKPVELLYKLINYAGIPARISQGLLLEDARRRQQPVQLIEIFSDKRWISFDVVNKEQGLQPGYFLWQRGGDSLLDIVGGSNSRVTFSMIQSSLSSLDIAATDIGQSGISWLGVHSLSVEEQGMFKFLFLLPLGVFVVVFMRLIAGIKTLGSFMPALIALAFVQTSLFQGIVSFIVIVTVGLIIRSYLSYLNLLLVSRIATLIVIVIILVTFFSLAGYHLGLSTGMTITFFPMIIIAWTIERLSILWEEESGREVLKQGGGSLLVAVVAYLVMTMPLAGHLTFNFPELSLVILAGIMLLGRYTGYRLSELYRFRDFKAASNEDN
ncbi:MAG TPA: inactive transglutaminase family protein [Spirochaetota bacterium]|nr:inactive transglutaminase family protein [Spirochaetota bacterium]